MRPTKLKTAQDFYNYFFDIPDSNWITGRTIDKENNACRCAIGHVLKVGRCSVSNLRKIMPNIVAYTNDGRNPDYQQSTPKFRMLAALADRGATPNV